MDSELIIEPDLGWTDAIDTSNSPKVGLVGSYDGLIVIMVALVVSVDGSFVGSEDMDDMFVGNTVRVSVGLEVGVEVVVE